MNKEFLDSLHDHRLIVSDAHEKIYSFVIALDILGLKEFGDKLQDAIDPVLRSEERLRNTYTKSLHDAVNKDQKEIGETLSALLKAGTYPNRDNG
jgi:hypothetical protein